MLARPAALVSVTNTLRPTGPQGGFRSSSRPWTPAESSPDAPRTHFIKLRARCGGDAGMPLREVGSRQGRALPSLASGPAGSMGCGGSCIPLGRAGPSPEAQGQAACPQRWCASWLFCCPVPPSSHAAHGRRDLSPGTLPTPAAAPHQLLLHVFVPGRADKDGVLHQTHKAPEGVRLVQHLGQDGRDQVRHALRVAGGRVVHRVVQQDSPGDAVQKAGRSAATPLSTLAVLGQQNPRLETRSCMDPHPLP